MTSCSLRRRLRRIGLGRASVQAARRRELARLQFTAEAVSRLRLVPVPNQVRERRSQETVGDPPLVVIDETLRAAASGSESESARALIPAHQRAAEANQKLH